MQEKLVKCPKCGNKNNYKVFDVINATKDEYLRKEVLNQNIFKYECTCGCKTQMFYPILYHDMNKKFMIQFTSTDGIEKYSEGFNLAALNNDFKDYRFRIVTRPYEITEKILVLESSYDDKVIEILKEMILASSTDNKISYLVFASDSSKGNIFLCLDENNVCHVMIPFREELYKSVYDMFYDKTLNDNCYVIDQDWARDFLCEVKI